MSHAQDVGLTAEVVKSATAVRDQHEDSLMNIAGAIGTGIAASDQPGHAAIAVYLDKLTPQAQATAPKEIQGVPVKLIESGEFDAFDRARVVVVEARRALTHSSLGSARCRK